MVLLLWPCETACMFISVLYASFNLAKLVLKLNTPVVALMPHMDTQSSQFMENVNHPIRYAIEPTSTIYYAWHYKFYQLPAIPITAGSIKLFCFIYHDKSNQEAASEIVFA